MNTILNYYSNNSDNFYGALLIIKRSQPQLVLEQIKMTWPPNDLETISVLSVDTPQIYFMVIILVWVKNRIPARKASKLNI